jgi:hypothetical protein
MAQRAMKPRKNKPSHVEQTSSPAKVYHSRASKPSAVTAIASPGTATAEDVANKLNELLAALKK